MPIVRDYTALLQYLEPASGSNDPINDRWNYPLDVGAAGVVITYTFLSASELPDPSELTRTADEVYSFTAAQRTAFRDAADVFEANADVRFVETTGDAMIEIIGVDAASTLGGWASYPQGYTSNPSGGYDPGIYAINTGDYPDLSDGEPFETLLHELGHAVGLKHSFAGVTKLATDLDNNDETVMSYTDGTVPNTTLGPLDTDALEHIYGTAQRSGAWKIAETASGWKVTGTKQADTIVGPVAETVMLGKAGNDTLTGRFYDDVLKGGGGSDTLNGLDGADKLLGGAGGDVLYAFFSSGTDFDDDGNVLKGGGGSDRLYSGRGDDDLEGGGAADRIYGGKGDDTLEGGGGADRSYGGDGFDTIYANTMGKPGAGSARDKLYGGDHNDGLFGAGGNELLVGGDHHDSLYGGGGKDTLKGGVGFDTLEGGGGNDKLIGGADPDTFNFGADAGGVDVITDFGLPSGGFFEDQITLDGSSAVLSDGVVSSYGNGAGTQIRFGDIGLTIKVRGIDPDTFTAEYWDFVA